MNKTQQQYMNKYLDSLSSVEHERIKVITVEYFCNSKKEADELAQLVLDGKKTATCSMKYWYDNCDEIKPQVGNIMVITDFEGIPICITQTTSVEIKRYCDVDEDFAYHEGEGDRTLSYWQKAHWQFFSEECQQQGIKPSKEMLLYLERFKVVYPSDAVTSK